MKTWVLLTLILLGGTAPLRADVITLRADEWCPFNCLPNNSEPGVLIELAAEVFAAAGHQVVYDVMSWNRALSEGRRGAHVGVVGASPGEAEGFVYPSVPQGFMRACLFVKRDNGWRFRGVSSLETLVLGAGRDYRYSPEIDRYIARHQGNLERVQFAAGDNPLETNIKKVVAGRIDVAVSDKSVMEHLLKRRSALPELVEAGCDREAFPLYVVFSAQHPKAKEYARILSEGTLAWTRSGRVKAILKKYGISP